MFSAEVHGTQEDDINEVQKMEKRVNQLTDHVKDMRKILDQLIALNESLLSQGDSEEKLNGIFSGKDCDEDKVQHKIISLELKLDLQQKIYEQDKLKWKQEREYMQKELEHCKSLLQDNNIDYSPTQKILADFTKDLPETLNSGPIRSQKYQNECTKPPAHFNHLCSVCGKKFIYKFTYMEHMADVHGIASFRTTENELIDSLKTVEKPKVSKKKQKSFKISEIQSVETIEESVVEQIENEEIQRAILESLLSSKTEKQDETNESFPALTEAVESQDTNEQQTEQKAHDPESLSNASVDVEEITKKLNDTLNLTEQEENWPVPPSPGTVDEAQVEKDLIDDETRLALRKSFLSQIVNHRCNELSHHHCTILEFRVLAKHANSCSDGIECTWYICKRVHAMTEHFRICENIECSICVPHIYFDESKMQSLIETLQKGCPSSGEIFEDMNKSMRANVINLVTRIAANYGLVGYSDKYEEIETTELDDATDECEVLYESASDDHDDDNDKDDDDKSDRSSSSSGKGATSEGWELVDSERYSEVD